MPDRLRLVLAPVAAATLLLLAGCGGAEPDAPLPSPTAAASSVVPSSAAPSSAEPTPTTTPSPSASPSSASPSSASASPTPTGSASPASTADGTYASELSVSEDGALSYVPLRWYAGQDAEARCVEKDVAAEGAWCVEYYYEETGGRKASALTESTEVRLLNDDLKPVDGTLTGLVTAIEEETWPYFQIATSGGNVTRITQVFTP